MGEAKEHLLCDRCGWDIAEDDDQECAICGATLCGHCGRPNVDGDPICAPLHHFAEGFPGVLPSCREDRGLNEALDHFAFVNTKPEYCGECAGARVSVHVAIDAYAARVRAATLKEAAKAVCSDCAEGIAIDSDSVVWWHPESAETRRPKLCKAHAIRALIAKEEG